jgi:hypothetical protein
MAYYPKTIFYPVIGSAHGAILQFAARAVRQPVFMVNGSIAQLPAGDLPAGVDIALLDDCEHVLTVNTANTTVQFSQERTDLAVSCAGNGWLEVKQ